MVSSHDFAFGNVRSLNDIDRPTILAKCFERQTCPNSIEQKEQHNDGNGNLHHNVEHVHVAIDEDGNGFRSS